MSFFKKMKKMFNGREYEEQRLQREAEAKREEEARREAEAKREEEARREAEAKREEEARREAEAKREEEARREAEAQREEEARRESEAKREEEARREAEAKREEEARREAEAKREEEARREAEAKREEEARREAEAQREEEARRESEAKREEEARREAEAKREEEARRESEAKREEEARRESEAKREEEARREAEAKREEEARREAEAKREEEARRESEAKREEEVKADNTSKSVEKVEEELSKKEQKLAKKEEKRKIKEEKKARKRDKFEVFDKYKQGMQKTRSSIIGNLKRVFNSYSEINEELYEDLEEIFIMADIGVDTVLEMIDKLRESVTADNITNPEDLQELIVDKLFEIYVKGEVLNTNIKLNKEGLSVILFVGVNGSGKTTTISKVANMLVSEGKSVLLAAGDTFRAGAIDQLKVWGERIGIDTITREPGSDPSAVMYDAIEEAKKRNVDVLLCDTAGRLQNKVNLMKELEKIKRVISREIEDAPHETLLVVDATTGQNGMSQAKHFLEATDVSGVVLTKLDGTAKGGIALAIRNELNLPIKFVTLGEKMEDLEYFDIESYMYGLFSDLFDE